MEKSGCRGHLGLVRRTNRWVSGLRGRIYYGWFVAAATAGAEFGNAASAIAILTIFVNPMTEEFGWSRTQISGATSVGAILGAALAPFTGRLVDRFGSRLILTIGGIALAASCFYLAAAQTLAGFYIAFTIARTADQGMIKIGTLPVVAKWFQVYRGRAMASVSFIGLLGVIVMAPVVHTVIDAWGWRVAWVMLGGVMILVGVLPSALIVRRQPEDMGLTIDGITDVPSFDGVLGLNEDDPTGGESDQAWTLRQVIRTQTFWLILVSLFAISIANAGVVLHLIPHLTEQGLSEGSAVGTISVFSASAASATLLIGILTERLSPRLMMLWGYLMAGLAMFVLTVADTIFEAYLFAVIQGAAAGGINVLAPILLASYYGRWILGSIYGIVRSAQVVGFAIGTLLSGIVYDATGSYQNAFESFLIIALLSSALMILARRPTRAITRPV